MKLGDMQKEVVEGGATRKTRLSTDWIPRPPERQVLCPAGRLGWLIQTLCCFSLSLSDMS